ncbi:MAG: ABC transporter ATP-binding protein [Bacteroidales bacterium]|nr:ABC transporter ATP-binding protein [Bacteroidales bacterium]
MIQATQLTKRFKSDSVETTAVRAIDLTIAKGEFVAIMGPSGCGKTTLLNLLGLIDRPTSGSISLNGFQSSPLSENEMTRLRRGYIGFIFQNFNLVDELNVSENVELPLIFKGIKRKERKERVGAILDSLKLGHRGRHYPQQLSGGQQQGVAFARAIVNRPRLLLADEPTGNLDSKNGTAIMDLLTEHNRKGATVVMVTHSLKDASYAHRIINLHDGAILN